jgi:hypothetical protein
VVYSTNTRGWPSFRHRQEPNHALLINRPARVSQSRHGQCGRGWELHSGAEESEYGFTAVILSWL